MKGLEVKKHIAAVIDTVKITRAMQMISLSKQKKLQEQLLNARNYFLAVQASFDTVAACTSKLKHPYINVNAKAKTLYVLIMGEKGLCGDYNNMLMKAYTKAVAEQSDVYTITIGEKATAYLRKIGTDFDSSFEAAASLPTIKDAYMLMQRLSDLYKKGEIDSAYIVYADSKSLTDIKAKVEQILPITASETAQASSTMLFDPEERVALDYILTEYIIAKLYFALCEACYSECYKRMMTMQQATTNGEQMVDYLQGQYNKKRQESITNELLDANSCREGRIE